MHNEFGNFWFYTMRRIAEQHANEPKTYENMRGINDNYYTGINSQHPIYDIFKEL